MHVFWGIKFHGVSESRIDPYSSSRLRLSLLRYFGFHRPPKTILELPA